MLETYFKVESDFEYTVLWNIVNVLYDVNVVCGVDLSSGMC